MGTFKNRPALMFATGPETQYEYIQTYLNAYPNCVIACADGGVRHASALGLTPDLVVGDFDSTNALPSAGEVVRLLPEKNDTDAQHCLRALIARGCREVTLVCATGGRLDHTLANLALAEQAHRLGCRCGIMDAQNLAFLYEGGKQIFQARQEYRFFSIIPLDAQLYGVTICGAKYPLENATISRVGMISISNEAIEDTFSIEIAQGAAMIILSND